MKRDIEDFIANNWSDLAEKFIEKKMAEFQSFCEERYHYSKKEDPDEFSENQGDKPPEDSDNQNST